MPGSEPILQARHRDSRFTAADMRPFSVFNGVAQDFAGNSIDGPSVDGVETTGDGFAAAGTNRIVEFEGEVYWWHGNDIRVYIPGSGWTRGETPTGGRGVQTEGGDTQYPWSSIGLFPIVTENGEQELIALYTEREDIARYGLKRKQSRITGDGTWGAEEIFDATTNSMSNQIGNFSPHGYYELNGNKLYMQWHDNNGLYDRHNIVDLEKALVTEVDNAPNLVTIASGTQVNERTWPDVFCNYSGTMWHMYRYGGVGATAGTKTTAWIIEKEDQIFPKARVLISGLAPDGTTAWNGNPGDPRSFFEGRAELFVDRNEGRMYAMMFVRGSGDRSGHAVLSLRYDEATDRLINEGDVGGVVLPPALRITESINTTCDARNRWKAYNLVDASGAPTTILEYSATGEQGKLVNTYQWNGPNQEMTYLGQGGDASWSRPHIKIGGGHRVWDERQPYNFSFRTTDSGAPRGAIYLYTRVHGSGQSVSVRWLWSKDRGPMTNYALVQNPTSGTLVNVGGNTEISGIIANGAEFRVEWRLEDQGVLFTEDFDIHPAADN